MPLHKIHQSTSSRPSEDKELDSDDGIEIFAKGPKCSLPRRSTLKRKKTVTSTISSPEVQPICQSELKQSNDCCMHVDVVKKLLIDHLLFVYKDLPSLLPPPSKFKAMFSKDLFFELEKCLEKQEAEKLPSDKLQRKEKNLRRDILKKFTSYLSSHSGHGRQFGQQMGDTLHQLENRIV
jgi:hypothetical protein